MRHPAACKRLEDIYMFGATASAGKSTSRPQDTFRAAGTYFARRAYFMSSILLV
jgi:hypothetical protein